MPAGKNLDAKAAKAHRELQNVVEQYVRGEVDYKAVQAAEKKCIKAGGLLDFHGKSFLKEEKHAFKRAYIDDRRLSEVHPAWWAKVKKDAGVKASGFFRKADASVGKHIAQFRKDLDAWKKTVNAEGGSPGGDGKKLIQLLKSAKELDAAFAKFLAAKEFKTELAKDLQKKLVALRSELAGQIAYCERAQQEHVRRKQALVADLKKAGVWR